MTEATKNQIIALLKKHDFTARYDTEKGFHVVREHQRDASVYIQFKNGYFGLKFRNDFHYPDQMERDLPRIRFLIYLTNKANDLLIKDPIK